MSRLFPYPVGPWLLMLLLVMGCGSDSITGNLPPVTGRLYSSTDPDQPVEGAEVTLITEGGEEYRAVTGPDGAFQFDQVPAEKYTLHIQPPPGGPLELEATELHIDDRNVRELVIGLKPKALEALVESLAIQPREVTLELRPDAPPIQFHVTIKGHNVDRLHPTWLVRGSIGTIDPHGRFTPQRVGRGKVIARLGQFQVEAIVRVIPALVTAGVAVRPTPAGSHAPQGLTTVRGIR